MNAPSLPEPLPVLAARVGEALRARGQTVAVVESSAGGLVSAALLAIAGASAYFKGGAVVYSRRAGRVCDTHHSTWGIAESGAAGPSPSPYGDVPGRVCLAIVGPVTVSRTVETGNADRPANMDLFARHLLALFDETLRARSVD